MKRTGRDYLGRWMQDANNDEGRRTNDVRLFVHSSHSVDRMSPSVLNSFGVRNRGWAVTLSGKQKVVVIMRRDNLLRHIEYELFQFIYTPMSVSFCIFFKYYRVCVCVYIYVIIYI